ncbi:MAG: 50S ribosomal protein L19 [Microgenomates group bacterium]|nr:50S ribosomal protein L19 [Microgenomates group bacterium]
MAKFFLFKDKKITVGDTIEVAYKLKEAGKERQQLFKGILIKIKGDRPENRMITVRRLSRSGIGVERIFPLVSPSLVNIKVTKKGMTSKAKLYFIRNISEAEIRQRIYKKQKK